MAFALQQSRADYADVVNAFVGIRANSVFPVPSRGLDDIEFDFEIVERAGGITVSSHTLDWNQRTGYDASSTATLDSRDLTKPHADPISGALAGTGYLTELVVPALWTQAFQNGDYDLRVTATDLWGNTAQFTDVVVPEPAGMLAVTATALAGAAWRGRRNRVHHGI